MSLRHLIARAKDEIRHLRHDNEILAAKCEVLNIFKAALLGPPRGIGMSEDVAWLLEKAKHDLMMEEQRELVEQKTADEPPARC